MERRKKRLKSIFAATGSKPRMSTQNLVRYIGAWTQWLKDNADSNHQFALTGTCPELPPVRIFSGLEGKTHPENRPTTYPCHANGNVGVLSLRYPIDEKDAGTLRSLAKQSGFGKGAETLFDETVRSGKELLSDQFAVDPDWTDRILNGKILQEVATQLKCNGLRAEPYKLLCYQTGDHFKMHVDTLRGHKHIATLILFLPSDYEGGALVVKQHAFAKTESKSFWFGHKIGIVGNWVAFYTDCPHTILPVTKGQRFTIQYNLYLSESEIIDLKRRKMATNVNNQALKGRPAIDWAQYRLRDLRASIMRRTVDIDPNDETDNPQAGNENHHDQKENHNEAKENQNEAKENQNEVFGLVKGFGPEDLTVGFGCVLDHQYSAATLTEGELRGNDRQTYRLLERCFGPSPFALGDILTLLPPEILGVIRSFSYSTYALSLVPVTLSVRGFAQADHPYSRDGSVPGFPVSYLVSHGDPIIRVLDQKTNHRRLCVKADSDSEDDADNSLTAILFNDPTDDLANTKEEPQDMEQQLGGNSGTSFAFQYTRAALLVLPTKTNPIK